MFLIDQYEAQALAELAADIDGQALSVDAIKRALDGHFIDCLVEDGRVLADTCDPNRPGWIDLTGTTLPELRDWLGY